MSQTPPERDDADAWLPEVQPEVYGISPDLVRAVAEALDEAMMKQALNEVVEAVQAEA